MGKPKKGRVVWNHSTHIDGLIAVLERLTDCDEITTVTPGVISRSKSHSPHMQLKVSVPIRGGFKAIARQGKSVQEVFVVTTLSQADLEDTISNALK
ncbi:MAG: metal-binding protein [Hormoscilla sp. SP12CHS1]|nr:metal-binding protein [Hormoscilla sp. SP12CHS1]